MTLTTYFALSNTDLCQNTAQLIGFIQKIADNLDHGEQTDVIVMDLSKAFDKVDHHKLVHKLKHMGINPYFTKWIKDFYITGHNRS